MGIAHGLPGLLLILCEIHDKGIMQNAIKKVLYDGAKFILNFKRNQKLIKDKKEHSLYPSFINLKLKPNYSNRLAWCYGDIGILFLLHRLHLTLNDDLFLKEAEELAELVCQRKSKKGNLIEESQFCHGTAGLAQMFLRLYQLTNIKKYKKLYDFWIKETLKLLDKEFETGTYDGREGEVLEGYVGVGLVLLSYYSKESLFWDRMFLLS